MIDRGIDGVGRGIARFGKSLGRAVGRTRELDPAHRRDGLGFALLVLGVVAAAGIWWGAGGPVGGWISGAVAAVVGLGAVVLPVLLVATGVLLMGTPPHPESRPRVAVGSLLLALGVLGLVHIVVGRPDEPALWSQGGGAIGYVAATPLATGLTSWVAVPVLVLLSGYAFLVLTGTPVRAVPNRVRRLLGQTVEEPLADASGEQGDAVTDTPPVALRRPARRRQASRTADVYRDDPEETPDALDPPAGEEAPARPKRKPAAPVPATPPAEAEPGGAVGEQLRLTVQPTEGDAPYKLPPSDLLPTGPAPKTRSRANTR